MRIGLSNEAHANSCRRRAIIDPLRFDPVTIMRYSASPGYASLAPLSKVASIPGVPSGFDLEARSLAIPLPLAANGFDQNIIIPLVGPKETRDAETSGP
jgi:hypothetical protein